MSRAHQPWYRTTWGLPIAVVLSPLWLIWKKSRRNRTSRIIVNGATALLAFIILVSIFNHLFKSTPSNTANNSQTTAVGNTGGGTVVLTSYGATEADWDNNHTADTSTTAGTAFDPTSGLGNGYNDKYAAMIWVDGRALGYQIGFPNGTSQATAQATVMQEFPSDTTVLWQQENTSDSVNICYQIEVRSPTLGTVLNSSGDVFVEFQSISTSDTSTSDGYYANNVNNATLRDSSYKTASAVGGC